MAEAGKVDSDADGNGADGNGADGSTLNLVENQTSCSDASPSPRLPLASLKVDASLSSTSYSLIRVSKASIFFSCLNTTTFNFLISDTNSSNSSFEGPVLGCGLMEVSKPEDCLA